MLTRLYFLGLCSWCAWLFGFASASAEQQRYTVRQITFGPKHHFFGYIGHVGTIPWNASGRYIIALRVGFQDRLPGANDAAEIILLDTRRDYAARVVDQTHAWNPQQGTMLYWNPQASETQFFFNDRDPATGKIFTVLFDIAQGAEGKRIREYRFHSTPIGNSGVAQQGGFFLGINYARLARLRPVTGYRGAWDWTVEETAPADDGIFKVDVSTGKKQLLVSYAQLRDKLRSTMPNIEQTHLFINHTLWNRDGDRIYFFVRGNFSSKLTKVDVPMTIDLDGKLVRQQSIGGHPECDQGHTMIGHVDGQQVLYDTDSQQVLGRLGSHGFFPQPGGDIALSADGTRFVNGYGNKKLGVNYYAILSRKDNKLIRTHAFPRGDWTSGPLRLDPAPCWNRSGDKILVPAIADDREKTRQMFVIGLLE